ncbi:hypothetical protein [Kitasatospora humi]|uniref:hypothetical protein n=1 Tax=Kitasatospora humi TaxID=2893891 RepID=UPI0024BF46E2|nr:hypothetical protein [Kitasatospora humi]
MAPIRSPFRRTTCFLLPLILGLTAWLGTVPTAASAAVSTAITIDGTQPGRVFDGVGAISGGGGNSRLLIDYPEPQRSQLLDYLFKPGYGASLQILKIEIGGDTNTTDGAEPSIEHTRGAVDCDQGYEWWLAQQAKARNPDIKLYALAWGAPGWVGVDDPGNPTPGSPYFWSADMQNYLVSWLGCAAQHDLSVDYLGGWNERGYSKSWYESLRTTLNANGYHPKIVADDGFGWGVANDVATDPAFAAAVDVVGTHYPCGYLENGSKCKQHGHGAGARQAAVGQ